MDKDILYRKLKRLKTISSIFQQDYPKISDQLMQAYQCLSDPSTSLDIVPRESLIEEVTSLRLRMGKTSNENRKIFESFVLNDIKDDKELIKRKIRNMKIDNEDDLITISSCLIVIRKILSGMTAELNLPNNRMGEENGQG